MSLLFVFARACRNGETVGNYFGETGTSRYRNLDAHSSFARRSEVALGSCLIQAFREFHAYEEDCLADKSLRSPGDIGIAFHMYSSDATNSNVWQQSKLFSTLISSSYMQSGAAL